jgi:RHS repeat-associated protein
LLGWLRGLVKADSLFGFKDKTQVQQKRYRYTGKERDDSSGLCYYGARYLAPWLTRWISPDAAGAVDGLNLYVYVDNNS